MGELNKDFKKELLEEINKIKSINQRLYKQIKKAVDLVVDGLIGNN